MLGFRCWAWLVLAVKSRGYSWVAGVFSICEGYSVGAEDGLLIAGASLVAACGLQMAQLVKNPPAMRETRARSLGWEDPLEKGKAAHSTTLAWRIQSMGSQRIGHDWAAFTFTWLVNILLKLSSIYWLLNCSAGLGLKIKAFHRLQQPRQSKRPLTEEWIKKTQYIYTSEYYLIIKKNEIMPFAATCLDLEVVTLSEVGQTEKGEIS